jgi:molecular chaperone DnaK
VRAAATDAGAAATAEDRLRDFQADLDDIEELAEVPRQTRALLDLLAEAGELVEQVGQPRDEQELAALRDEAQRAIDDQNVGAMGSVTEQVELFLGRLSRRQPGWLVAAFYAITEQPGLLPATREADELVRQGRAALGDERRLEPIVQQLVRLIPRDKRETVVGLMK